MNASLRSKQFIAVALTAIVLSTGCFAKAENLQCGQDFRQLSITSAHAIAALICNLHANNLTEKSVRNQDNSFNFIHKWQVRITEENFEIDATCSTALRSYHGLQRGPLIVHPGFRLQLKLPRMDEKCDPIYKGTLTEIFSEQQPPAEGIFEKAKVSAARAFTQNNVRTVSVKMQDTGYRDTTSGEIRGGRTITHLGLGTGLGSILRSGFTNASLNQGSMSSEVNSLAFGQGRTMSYRQFFYKETSGLKIPDFSQIKSEFQFNKALDPSLANRDSLKMSGFSRDLYIRQTGVTNSVDDARMDYRFVGGTSAFYVRNYDVSSRTATVFGCTDYSYSGDMNIAGTMTTTECRQMLSGVPGY